MKPTSLLTIHGDLEIAQRRMLSEEQVKRLERLWRKRLAEGRDLPNWVYQKSGLPEQIKEILNLPPTAQ